MPLLRALLRLTRLDSSVLALLALFIPLWARTGNPRESFLKALPLLFAFMCTFIANDLEDIEKDQINHPDRPLPAGHLTPASAAVLYFAFLGLALFSTRYFVSPGIAFIYYLLIALLISYGHVVEWLPGLKSPYVASVITIPIFIVATLYPTETELYRVALAAFLLVVGREICMDVRDRPGDTINFMHSFRPTPLVALAVGVQLIGLVVLGTLVRNKTDLSVVLGMSFLLSVSGILWFVSSKYREAIFLMKLQWLLGLYFVAR